VGLTRAIIDTTPRTICPERHRRPLIGENTRALAAATSPMTWRCSWHPLETMVTGPRGDEAADLARALAPEAWACTKAAVPCNPHRGREARALRIRVVNLLEMVVLLFILVSRHAYFMHDNMVVQAKTNCLAPSPSIVHVPSCNSWRARLRQRRCPCSSSTPRWRMVGSIGPRRERAGRAGPQQLSSAMLRKGTWWVQQRHQLGSWFDLVHLVFKVLHVCTRQSCFTAFVLHDWLHISACLYGLRCPGIWGFGEIFLYLFWHSEA
jgi:hypothetical protein